MSVEIDGWMPPKQDVDELERFHQMLVKCEPMEEFVEPGEFLKSSVL